MLKKMAKWIHIEGNILRIETDLRAYVSFMYLQYTMNEKR